MLDQYHSITLISKGYKQIFNYLIEHDFIVDRLVDAYVFYVDGRRVPIRALRLFNNEDIQFIPIRPFRESFNLDKWFSVLSEDINWNATVPSIFKSLFGFSM